MYEFRQYLPYLLSLSVEEESFEKVRLSERQSQLLISSGAACLGSAPCLNARRTKTIYLFVFASMARLCPAKRAPPSFCRAKVGEEYFRRCTDTQHKL